MFEEKPSRPGLLRRSAASPEDERGEGGALRSMAWDELLSRLAAARDLRAELNAPQCGEASFHAGSARRIAGLLDGKHSINPDDLGNRKGTCLNEGTTDQDSKPVP